MPTSYDVRIWSVQTHYKTIDSKRVPTRYLVRWRVDDQKFDRTFGKDRQAETSAPT